jgi:hypothetical protein
VLIKFYHDENVKTGAYQLIVFNMDDPQTVDGCTPYSFAYPADDETGYSVKIYTGDVCRDDLDILENYKGPLVANDTVYNLIKCASDYADYFQLDIRNATEDHLFVVSSFTAGKIVHYITNFL